jgi:hypothetical protein
VSSDVSSAVYRIQYDKTEGKGRIKQIGLLTEQLTESVEGSLSRTREVFNEQQPCPCRAIKLIAILLHAHV